MNQTIKAYISVMFAMLFFAFSYVWYKIANEVYRPITIVFFRLLIAVILLNLFLFISGKYEKINKKDRKLFLLIAVFEPFLYFIFESHGLSMISSTVGSVIISVIPIFTALGAYIIFREKLSIINYLGVVISFAGICMFFLLGDSNLEFNLRGSFLMLSAVVCAAGYSLVLRKLTANYSPVYIVNVQNIIGLILFIPVFIISEKSSFSEIRYDPDALVAVIKLAVFASCGAFILFGYSVRYIGVTRANMFSNLIPVLTAIIAYFILQEEITIIKSVAIIIIITGLYFAQIKTISYQR